jgi:hypothetical protein
MASVPLDRPADGFYDFSIAVTLSNGGTLTLLRFLDGAGQVIILGVHRAP